METVFAGVGFLTIAFQAIFYTCTVSYVAFIASPIAQIIYTAYEEPQSLCTDNSQTTMIWILVTNCVALTSGILFMRFAKGEAASVIGSLCYILNFFSMIALFIYSQVKLAAICNNLGYWITMAYIITQWLKIFLFFVSVVILVCITRSKFILKYL